jgi:hypothetical protein
MNPDIVKALAGPAEVFGFALASLALAALTRWLHQKAQSDKQNKLLTALSVLSQAVDSAVTELEANMRPTMAVLTANGQLTPEQGKALKDAAVKTVEDQASTLLGQVLKVAGIPDGVMHDTIVTLVDQAAAKLAGNTRVAMAQQEMMLRARAAMQQPMPPPPPPAAQN